MIVSETALLAWLYAFARLAGWAVFDPLSGRLPLFLRLFLAAALAAGLAPGFAPSGAATSTALLPALLLEALWGASLALVVWLVFALAHVALQWAGHTATGGFLALTDAQAGYADASWRTLAGWIAAIAFLTAGGHLLVVAALRESFVAMPVALWPEPDDLLRLAESASRLFAVGAQLALPLLAFALLIQLALGIVARTLPGLDMFSTGLALAAVGLLAAWIVAAPMLAHGVRAALEHLALWPGLPGAR